MIRLLQIIMDDNEMLSSARLAFLFWALGILLVWIYISIKGMSLADIPDSVILIIGILMSGKVVQKFGEKKGEKNIEKK